MSQHAIISRKCKFSWIHINYACTQSIWPVENWRNRKNWKLGHPWPRNGKHNGKNYEKRKVAIMTFARKLLTFLLATLSCFFNWFWLMVNIWFFFGNAFIVDFSKKRLFFCSRVQFWWHLRIEFVLCVRGYIVMKFFFKFSCLNNWLCILWCASKTEYN